MAFELSMMLDEHDKYLKAVMSLCNRIAASLEARRVSLGWVTGNQIKLQATSHLQKFDRRLPSVKQLESAMEECADQDEEVVWPRFTGCNYISREHENLVQQEMLVNLVSLPIRYQGKVVAVLTYESDSNLLRKDQVRALRLVCDICARRLFELYERTRWIGVRMLHTCRKHCAMLVGAEHTWAKIAAIAVSGVLAFLIFYPWDYRVSADFTLKTESLIHRPAPMDGYIKEVHAEVGDLVMADTTLVSLDKRRLLLKQNEIYTRIKRLQAEAQQAQSNGEMSKVHQANMKVEETKAELKKINYQLLHADVRAMYDGIVVEGDLKDRIHAPVSKGDPLFKITRVEDMYVRALIPESDIDYVDDRAFGEIAFSSRPSEKYRIKIEKIEPVGESKQKGTFFYARAQVIGQPDQWWRPGMTGVAKIDVGERSVLWVLSHRLIDFLRMKLWI